jgi:hypothetical protein
VIAILQRLYIRYWLDRHDPALDDYRRACPNPKPEKARSFDNAKLSHSIKRADQRERERRKVEAKLAVPAKPQSQAQVWHMPRRGAK